MKNARACIVKYLLQIPSGRFTDPDISYTNDMILTNSQLGRERVALANELTTYHR